MKKRRIHLLQFRSIKEIINFKKIPMNHMVGPRVSINLNGQGKMKVIINPPELCGAPHPKLITKTKSQMKIIQNIYGAHLLPQEVELGPIIRMIREPEMLLLREQKPSKKRRKVLLITICLILVKLLGVYKVEAFHKFRTTKIPIDLQVTPDILTIISIQQLEHPRMQLTIYKNLYLIK